MLRSDVLTIGLGREVKGQLVRQEGADWIVDMSELPDGWTAVLKSRQFQDYREGHQGQFWVFAILARTKEVLLSDSDFGRSPISDRMRPRYIKGLTALLRIITLPGHELSIDPDDLSEAKGLFNRCVRKDQWDWFTVYQTLDFLDPSALHAIVHHLHNLRRALVDGDKEQIGHLSLALRDLDLAKMLRRALARIQATTPRLPAAIKAPQSQAGNEEYRHVEAQPSPRYRLAARTLAKHDQANRAHKDALSALQRFLTGQGFLVEYNQFIDAYCQLKTGSAIFEVKSISAENEIHQCREALSQLYEYRYRHQLQGASLWLVLSEQPATSWLLDYLHADRGINVIWLNDGRLAGPDLESLLKSWPTLPKGQHAPE